MNEMTEEDKLEYEALKSLLNIIVDREYEQKLADDTAKAITEEVKRATFMEQQIPPQQQQNRFTPAIPIHPTNRRYVVTILTAKVPTKNGYTFTKECIDEMARN